MGFLLFAGCLLHIGLPFSIQNSRRNYFASARIFSQKMRRTCVAVLRLNKMFGGLKLRPYVPRESTEKGARSPWIT
jgi:hypothetical protein